MIISNSVQIICSLNMFWTVTCYATKNSVLQSDSVSYSDKRHALFDSFCSSQSFCCDRRFTPFIRKASNTHHFPFGTEECVTLQSFILLVLGDESKHFVMHLVSCAVWYPGKKGSQNRKALRTRSHFWVNKNDVLQSCGADTAVCAETSRTVFFLLLLYTEEVMAI